MNKKNKINNKYNEFSKIKNTIVKSSNFIGSKIYDNFSKFQ